MTSRRRSKATSPNVPRSASPDMVAHLQDALRISRQACAEIVDIIENVERRCEIADGPVTPTLQEMSQSEISRIYKLAQRGSAGAEVPGTPCLTDPAPPADVNDFVLHAHKTAFGRSAGNVVNVAAGETPKVQIQAGKTYKALTIHQPWASLLLTHYKRLETRPMRTNYRGPLVIHSGLTRFKGGHQYDHAFLKALSKAFGRDTFEVMRHVENQLPYGMALGMVVVERCRRIERVDFFKSDRGARLHLEDGGCRIISPEELAFGNFAEGRFIIETAHPVTFTTPHPARGNQGFWDWEPRVA